MKKILVVDNHPVMLKFMTNLLEKEGHEVLTAHDGLSALKQSDLVPPREMTDGVIGLDDVYAREVTRELLSSKRHLERILDNMSEGIIELNPEARIVYANPVAVSLIGIPEEMLLSQPFPELFHETHREGIKDLIDEGIGDEQHTIGEDSPLILNGKRILLNMLQLKGEEQKSVILIMNDISERKRIEAQLRQAQKMESIATLAGGIAHQFNNALSVITGNIELLKMSSPENDENAEYTEPIKNSAYRMAHLTSQLLAYARGGKYNPKTMSLSAFIEDTFPLIRHSINPGIQMKSNLPELSYNIEADFTQMQMVLSAVVSNASEAIVGKGCIRITSAIEDILDHHPHLEPGRYACLRVEDDGKGMDEEIRNRMFEPFFTTNFQGRGLVWLRSMVLFKTMVAGSLLTLNWERELWYRSTYLLSKSWKKKRKKKSLNWRRGLAPYLSLKTKT